MLDWADGEQIYRGGDLNRILRSYPPGRESKGFFSASLAILYMLTIRPVEIKADGIAGRSRSESWQDIVAEQ